MMEQLQSYSGVMRQVAASLAANREQTVRDLATIHTDLLEKSRGVAERIGRSEDVPLAGAIDVEQIATLSSAADLLCQAHASPDRVLFAEAEMRAEGVASLLDQIADAYRAGDPHRLETLRTDVGSALQAFAD